MKTQEPDALRMLAQRGREITQLTRLPHRHPFMLSEIPFNSKTLSLSFLGLCSLPVNWLLASPLDQSLSLFSSLEKAFGLKYVLGPEPHHKVFPVHSLWVHSGIKYPTTPNLISYPLAPQYFNMILFVFLLNILCNL